MSLTQWPTGQRRERKTMKALAQEFPYPDESYRIIGACFEVYNEKGCGFLEAVYHDCLVFELGIQAIPFRHEPPIPLFYKGRPLPRGYSPDFTCWDKIVVELKAEDRLAPAHVGQLLNYLNATGYELGLLVNFGHYPGLEWRRFVRTQNPRRVM
ncbi:MAG TPA: GxxExxY protein [Opitutaceae bacterium]|nr:GxxExxY protein [Opitutaceae bacterium]